MVKIPKNLQPILWSQKIENLDPRKNRVYIIHQVLRYGSLDNLKWLLKTYSEKEIKNIFIEYPLPLYTPQSLYFAKKILLDINLPLDEKKYLKSYI